MFEKVEKLRERANVSYEEAKNALERSNGDMLDAMILLERESNISRCVRINSGYTGENESTGETSDSNNNRTFGAYDIAGCEKLGAEEKKRRNRIYEYYAKQYNK